MKILSELKWTLTSVALTLLLSVLLTGTVPPAEAQGVSFASSQTTVSITADSPYEVAVDGSGNIFYADQDDNAVKEIVAAGGYTTVNILGSGFKSPHGVAVDGSGNVFVADTGHYAVKEIVAASGYTTVDTLGSGFYVPYGVAVDGSGNVFVADTYNNAVKEIVAAGGYTTVNTLGSGFSYPFGVAVDGSGNVFVADSVHNAVKEIVAAGGYTTVHKLGSGFSFAHPDGVAVDGSGNVFVADTGNGAVEEIVAAGGYTTVNTLGGDFSSSYGVAVDGSGNVFVPDSNNDHIDELLQLEAVNFQNANLCPAGGTGTAPCSQTQTLNFNVAAGTTIGSIQILTQGAAGLDFQAQANDPSSTLCAAQTYNSATSCTVDVTFAPLAPGPRNGAVEVLDGSGNVLANAYIYGTGVGPQVAFSPVAATSPFTAGYPAGIATDGNGNIFVSDDGSGQGNGSVTRYSPGGVATQLATGLVQPSGIGVDGDGNVFYGDSSVGAVYEIPHGATASGPLASPTLVASVNSPDNSLAVDGAGNLYVPTAGGTIVKITQTAPGTWVTSNVATVPESSGGADRVIGMAIDASGNLYAAGFYSSTIYKIPAGTSTVTALTSGNGVSSPDGLAIDAAGNLYASNYSAPGGVVMLAAANYDSRTRFDSYEALAIALDPMGNLYVGDYVGGGSASKVERYALSTPPSLSFPSTNLGTTSSPETVTVENIGNAPLIFSTPATGQNPNFPANFAFDDGSTCPQLSPMSAPATLAAGSSCTLGIDFAPTATGTLGGSVVLTDNASPVTQFIAVSGMATDGVVKLVITGVGDTTADFPLHTITVTAYDALSKVDTAFAGVLNLTISGRERQTLTLAAFNGVFSFEESIFVAGNYTYTATDPASSISTSVSFTISAGAATLINIVQGNGQSAFVNLPFAAPLQVSVFDRYLNPVSGAAVSFSAPSSGASAVLSSPSLTGADGMTSVTATANAIAGPYPVIAATGHAASAYLVLINLPMPNYVVTTIADIGTGNAANCPIPSAGTTCSLRDALAAAGAAGVGNITFDPTVFASPQTLTLGSAGYLNMPSNTFITGPTTGSGATLTNLVTIQAGSGSKAEVLNQAGGSPSPT